MKILFVNLEDRFGACQRVLLKEMSQLKERGHEPYLFCLNESILHVTSKNLVKEYITIPMARDLSYFRSRAKNEFKKIIKEENIEMVILYGEVKAQTINWIMQSFPSIPFVLFLFESFNGVKRKQSLGRVDEFFTRSDYVSRDLQARYSISGLKIKKIDSFPNDMYVPDGNTEETDPFSSIDGKKNLIAGAIVNDDINRVSQLEDLFYAMKGEEVKATVRFFLFSTKKWTHRNIHSELRRTLKDYGIEDCILLKDLPSNFSFEDHSKKLKFWFAFNQFEAFNDDYLFALQNKIPTIFPRRPGNLEVLDNFELSGLSYKPGDSGDIRRAVQEMIDHQDRFRKSLSASGKKIAEYFGSEEHGIRLEGLINKVAARRKRVLRLSAQENSIN